LQSPWLAPGLLFLPITFFIPAVVDGVKSSQANSSLDKDFLAKGAKDMTIPPHSQLNTILFIAKENYQECFTVTLVDEETGELTSLTIQPFTLPEQS
jgi:hypothetical protein